MTHLELQIDKTDFLPEEILQGKFIYNGLAINEPLLMTLYWFTEGKGEQDIHAPLTVEFHTEDRSGEREFSILLPPTPHSFSGRLFNLHWVLELKALVAGVSIERGITIGNSQQNGNP